MPNLNAGASTYGAGWFKQIHISSISSHQCHHPWPWPFASNLEGKAKQAGCHTVGRYSRTYITVHIPAAPGRALASPKVIIRDLSPTFMNSRVAVTKTFSVHLTGLYRDWPPRLPPHPDPPPQRQHKEVFGTRHDTTRDANSKHASYNAVPPGPPGSGCGRGRGRRGEGLSVSTSANKSSKSSKSAAALATLTQNRTAQYEV